METFVMLTKLSSQAVTSPITLENLEKKSWNELDQNARR